MQIWNKIDWDGIWRKSIFHLLGYVGFILFQKDISKEKRKNRILLLLKNRRRGILFPVLLALLLGEVAFCADEAWLAVSPSGTEASSSSNSQ